MQHEVPQFVNYGKATTGGLLAMPHFVKSIGMATEPDYTQIGERLVAIRQGFSALSQKDWAEKHGFNRTQLNNWEKGARRIPVDEAEKLCATYGLTLDWIYRGRRDGLSDTASKVL